MKWSLKISHFAGIEVYILTTFLLLIAFFGFSYRVQTRTLAGSLEGVGFLLALFGSVVLHEYGHALTARRYDIKTRDITLLPFVRSLWLTEIAHVTEGRSFMDEQHPAPCRFWYHEHVFEPVAGGVQMTDRLSYALPFGLLGEMMHAAWVRRKPENIFDFRRRKVAQIFA